MTCQFDPYVNWQKNFSMEKKSSWSTIIYMIGTKNEAFCILVGDAFLSIPF